ncbi:alpha/beta hydrolase [Streptomyces uncialis]|uniref:alpha/beta hydrolase n=1 Tax=Streptomyces uncialis TaxID=1048205 RepID=UPI0033F6EF1B
MAPPGFLTTRGEVGAERICALGICAGGGSVTYAAQTDHRFKAVASVSGADSAYVSREAVACATGPKESCEVEGATHIDLYDKEEYLPQVTAKPHGFFRSALGDG